MSNKPNDGDCDEFREHINRLREEYGDHAVQQLLDDVSDELNAELLEKALELTIDGKPMSINRAYKTSSNRHGLYESKKMSRYKGRVKKAFKEADTAELDTPIRGPLELHLTFYFDRKHASNERLEGLAYPDVDGAIKGTLDAMEVEKDYKDAPYHDDSQIQRLRAKKRYSKSRPRTNIVLYKLRTDEIDGIKDRNEYETQRRNDLRTWLGG